jgi:hypothetical protein
LSCWRCPFAFLLLRFTVIWLQDTAHAEIQVLRNGMLSAETERDQALLRLEALQQALAASSDDAVKAALQQDAAAASGRAASSAGDSQPDAAASATAGEQQQPAGGIIGELGVVAGLRARVSELEAELRQVRSLQRMTSSVLVRGMSSGGMGLGRASVRGARGRSSSAAGGTAAGAGALGNRGSSRHGSPPLPHAAAGLGISLDGVSLEEEDVDACSPMTPARQAADELDEPLVVSVAIRNSLTYSWLQPGSQHQPCTGNRDVQPSVGVLCWINPTYRACGRTVVLVHTLG